MATFDFKSRLLSFSDSPLQKILFTVLTFFLLVLPGAVALRAGVSERMVLPLLLFSVPVLLVVSLWAKQFVEHFLLNPSGLREPAAHDVRIARKSLSVFPGPSAGMIAVVPALNEEGFIGQQVRALREFVAGVIVVDDNSTDRTGESAYSAGATLVELRSAVGGPRSVGVVEAINYGVQTALLGEDWILTEPTTLLLLREPVLSDVHFLQAFVRETIEHPLVLVSMPPLYAVTTRFMSRFMNRVRLKLLAGLVGFSMSVDSVSAVVLRADLARRFFPLSIETWSGLVLQLSLEARRLGIEPQMIHIEPMKISAKPRAHDTQGISLVDLVRLDLGVAQKATYRRQAS